MAITRFRNTISNNAPRLAFRDQSDSRTQPTKAAKWRNRGSKEVKQTEVVHTTHTNKAQSFKTVFLGDANVGKTCLAKLFVERQVLEQSTNTIGFDHHVKEIEVEGGVKVKLQVWDTAGMEQYRNALVTKYYRNIDGVVFVFDLTRRVTFENLETWIKEVRQYNEGLDSIKMIMIGNKQDRATQRKVSYDEGRAFAERYGMLSYQEVTAKSLDTLQTLDTMFTTLAEGMIDRRENMELTQSSVHRSGIISLSDDWELLDMPEDPSVPDSVYSPQEASIRLRARQKTNKCLC